MGATQSTQHPHTLETPKGHLHGLEERDLNGKPVLHRYTKIPYAQPPTGTLRWRRPQPLPPTTSFNNPTDNSPGDYTRFGPKCPQPVYNTNAALTTGPQWAPEIENVEDEDCLYLNIWVPANPSSRPKKGWPVQFFIHGGWLQVGNAMQSHEYDPFDLLAHSTPRIIVAPAYRLNVFGFAGGADLGSTTTTTTTTDPFAGNYGLWDQRLALEWTHANIGLFGGDPDLITVGGLSAGAHSAFLQVYHDTYLPASRRVIRQAHLYSNALAVQPNATTGATLTGQLDDVCAALSIPTTNTDARSKLEQLRSQPFQALRDTIAKISQHTFRASTDGPIAEGGFLPPTFLASLHSGEFATRLAANGTRLLLGEVRDEAKLYKLVNPPVDYESLIAQLRNYYPRPVVDALVALPLYGVPRADDADVPAEKWADVFGQIVADGQVHASVRGTVKVLLDPEPPAEGKDRVNAVSGNKVFRYRICWRAKGLDGFIKPEAGLCHAADTPIWWASGWRAGFAEEDKQLCLQWLEPFGRFLYGEEEIGWGGSGKVDELRLLSEDGRIVSGWKDEEWERGMTVWNAVWDAQKDSVQH